MTTASTADNCQVIHAGTDFKPVKKELIQLVGASQLCKHIFAAALEALVQGELEKTLNERIDIIMKPKVEFGIAAFDAAVVDMVAAAEAIAGISLLKNVRLVDIMYGPV
eukprot:9979563-Lingulodinium_polyedra.AAC.1